MSELEKEEWAIWEENSKLEYARNEGIAQGISKGRTEEQKELILSMIKNKINIDTISKVTNKTVEEIKEIIKE